jgi:hypothetical protein
LIRKLLTHFKQNEEQKLLLIKATISKLKKQSLRTKPTEMPLLRQSYVGFWPNTANAEIDPLDLTQDQERTVE